MASNNMGDTKKNRVSHQTSNEMERGTINPSGPTTGTEGWANHADLGPSNTSRTTSDPNANASSPNAEGAGDVRRTSYPRNEAADNPAAGDSERRREDRERTLEDNPNYRAGKIFRCADVGVANCNWSVTGTHEDEIVNHARDHARTKHNISNEDFDSKMRDRVRGALRNKAA